MANYKTILQLPVGTTPYQLTFEQPYPGKGVPQASTTVQYSFTPPLDAVTLWAAVHNTALSSATSSSGPFGTVTTRILVGA